MNFFVPSLTKRMVIGQVLSVIVFSILLVGNLLWEYRKQGEGEFDKHLLYSAKATALVLHGETTTAQEANLVLRALATSTNESIAMFMKDKGGDPQSAAYAMRVTDLDGREIYATHSYGDMPTNAQAKAVYSFNYKGHEWRGLNHRAPEQKLVVQIAQSTEYVDAELCNLVQTYILWPLLWFLPLAIITSSLVVGRGLRPLKELAHRIAQRTASDLSSLDYVAKHAETKPLVEEINSLLHKLDTTLNRERIFLTDAAHELRTPLAVIQAQVHVLRHAQSESEKTSASDELNIGIGRAASLIQKLLLTAKVSGEHYTPRLETVDLVSFVQERIAVLSVLAAHKCIDMELQAPLQCFVRADRDTFVSVIDNVLDNAIRYTPVEGQIKISIEPIDADKVRVRVADSGVGIAPELHERVFERFFRVSGTEQQGSGLGLAIVKRVLALHGGKVALSQGLHQRGLSVDLTMPVSA
jgi:two-component system, OmpR family, sensor histidine kinase QseC